MSFFVARQPVCLHMLFIFNLHKFCIINFQQVKERTCKEKESVDKKRRIEQERSKFLSFQHHQYFCDILLFGCDLRRKVDLTLWGLADYDTSQSEMSCRIHHIAWITLVILSSAQGNLQFDLLLDSVYSFNNVTFQSRCNIQLCFFSIQGMNFFEIVLIKKCI